MTSSALNVPARGNVLDGVDRILDKPRVSVYRAAAMNVNNATVTSIPWDTRDYDTDGMLTNTAIITCRTAGLYMFTAWIGLAANAAGYRQLYFQKTSGGVVSNYANAIQAPNAAIVSGIVANAQIPLSAGDFVETICSHNAGVALAVSVSTATNRDNGFQACLIST